VDEDELCGVGHLYWVFSSRCQLGNEPASEVKSTGYPSPSLLFSV